VGDIKIHPGGCNSTVKEKKSATEMRHKPVLRNLLLLSVLGVVLALSSATLAEYYFVYFVDCAPCHDHAWDDVAVAYGTGYCKLHTDEGNLPTGSVTMQAWVWASCDWDGWTLNESEVDALNEGQGMECSPKGAPVIFGAKL